MAKELGTTPFRTFLGHCGVLAFLFADITLSLYKTQSELFLNCKTSPIVTLFYILYETKSGGLSKIYMYLIAKRFVTRSRYLRIDADKIAHAYSKRPQTDNNDCEACNFIMKRK
jgi:hypothetical protein